MEHYIWETASETALNIAKRLRTIRKRRGFSQQSLSERSGVSYGSIKRFEQTGQISLESLIKLTSALDCLEEMRSMFTNIPYRSLEEVRNERKKCTRL